MPPRSDKKVSFDYDNGLYASLESNGTPDDAMATLLAGELSEPTNGVQHYFVPGLEGMNEGDTLESNGNNVVVDPDRTSTFALDCTNSQSVALHVDTLLELPHLPPTTSARP